MKKVNLDSPVLRKSELKYKEFEYKTHNHNYLPVPDVPNNRLFFDIINKRETRRNFNSISNEQLNIILWHSARTIRSSNNSQIRWEHRPALSAGGKHPIDLFILSPKKTENLLLYKNSLHALAEIPIKSSPFLQMLNIVKEVVDIQNGTLIWFGAQFNRTLARYKNGESLVWRDAGVLMTTITLVAESIDVNACPIGITGEPFFSKCLGTNEVIGVGGICLGSV